MCRKRAVCGEGLFLISQKKRIKNKKERFRLTLRHWSGVMANPFTAIELKFPSVRIKRAVVSVVLVARQGGGDGESRRRNVATYSNVTNIKYTPDWFFCQVLADTVFYALRLWITRVLTRKGHGYILSPTIAGLSYGTQIVF